MRKKISKWTLCLSSLLFSSVAYAGYPSGQDLLIACTGAVSDKSQSILMRIHCLGYIDGIIDAHGLLSAIDPSVKQYCIPSSGIATGDVEDKVISFIQKHEEARDMTGRVAVLKAMQKAYPCK